MPSNSARHKRRKAVNPKVNTMSIEKTFQGAYKISAIVNGYLVSKQYMGYTKREAIQAFKEFVKQG